MAVFTDQQQAAIGAANLALTVLRGVVLEATNLLGELHAVQVRPFMNGNLDGTTVFNTAVEQWSAIKGRIVVAANALP